MDLSAEKRKMPRMQVDLSTSIYWGLAKNRSDVNIQNLSIHGISFRSQKFFTQGTRFDLILPSLKKDSKRKKVQAEVVRCERLDGFSGRGKFKVGAKFLFQAHRLPAPKASPAPETLSSLQPTDSQNLLGDIYKRRLKIFRGPGDSIGKPGPSACGIRIDQVSAELVQSIRTPLREETVYTSIQIKQARFISSSLSLSSKSSSSEELLAGAGNDGRLPNLARLNAEDKQLP